MINCLVGIGLSPKDTLDSLTFSRISRYYNVKIPDVRRKEYLRKCFTDVRIEDDRRNFLSINWKYIYTLNIDDGIEKNSPYNIVLAPMRELSGTLTENEKCVIKIHGDANEMFKYTKGEDLCVLDIDQYIRSLKKNRPILSKLYRDYQHDNVMFVGCSLDDEIDLLQIFSEATLNAKIDTDTYCKIKHHYYITNSDTTPMQKIDLEAYEIDTIVKVDDYDNFYADFSQYAAEADNLPVETIDRYSMIKHQNPDRTIECNEKYLFYGKKPYDPSSNILTLPYFAITRDVFSNLSKSSTSAVITILCGTRVSGKSYCLSLLDSSIKDRVVYYFDSRCNINIDTLITLTRKERVTLIFDTTVINKSCIKYLIQNQATLNKLDNHIVIAINRSDHDILSYAEMRKGTLLNIIDLDNKFSEVEFNASNDKLSRIPLSPFTKPNSTILDNLIETSRRGLANRSYLSPTIRISSEYTLAVYILLATYEKVDDQSLIDYSLTSECNTVLKGVEYEIDDYYLFPFERSIIDNSSHRIICNAQFWLFSQLGSYALITAHYSQITRAYEYLVSRALENAPTFNPYKTVEELIKFDTLNMIFDAPSKGNRIIIRQIYEMLSDLLSPSYQYHHQYAKCLLWAHNNSLSDMKLALSHAQTSLQQVDNIVLNLEKIGKYVSEDDPLYISKSHIQFTLCLIYTGICENDNYQNISTILEALAILQVAFQRLKLYRKFIQKIKRRHYYALFIGLAPPQIGVFQNSSHIKILPKTLSIATWSLNSCDANEMTQQAESIQKALDTILVDSLNPQSLDLNELKNFSKYPEVCPKQPLLKEIPFEPQLSDAKYNPKPSFFIKLSKKKMAEFKDSNIAKYNNDLDAYKAARARLKCRMMRQFKITMPP